MGENIPVSQEFPVIEIGKRKLVLKADFVSIVRMSALGINQAEIRKVFSDGSQPENMDPGAVWTILRMFSCLVAGNFIDKENPAAPSSIPTPEYWSTQIAENQSGWGPLFIAVMQAYLKVIPPATGAAPAVTADAPKTN